ncbi:MAG: acyl-CoA dehydrogenase domain protein [Actinomycetia bacterium]|nr:acyl-CoA dehydrogenase domain protein [Actinomycetes bacterium]
MPIGISEDHEALRQVVRRFADAQCTPAVSRAALDAPREERPSFWPALAELGWLGLHVGEEHGGAGYGFVEQCVVIEELGRAAAPGPYVPSVLASALVQAAAASEVVKAVLPGLTDGSVIGAVAFDGAEALDGTETSDGLQVSGTLRPVLGAHLADMIVAPVRVAGGATEWVVLEPSATPELSVTELPSVDRTRRVASVVAGGANVPNDRRLGVIDAKLVRATAAVLFAAEAVGIGQWCVETAADYANARVQFGRPIGQFQGVKHRSADMLARTELARAAAWDAARALHDPENGRDVAVASAAALAFDAAFRDAKDCVQTLGGIGFTWEHDAHIYLRRALTLHQLAGTPAEWRVRAARAAAGQDARRLAIDLGDEADALRAEVREFIATITPLESSERRVAMAENGYITPGWPKPWGRDASALELLVIEEEFRGAKIRRPAIGVAAWALPTLIVFGSPEQQDRWIRPSLRGELQWCQLFSEPGAGSDLASLSTRATRTDGGWLLNGQKVWTSLAQQADWGICLARTDPEAPKHDGISCFMLDMHTPGIDIRPLRELTGQEMFNEVFFDDVFVPDDCLVGAENDGWRCARTTLANERVYMGGSNTIGGGVMGVLRAIDERGLGDDRLALDEAGGLVATSHALAVLGFRMTLQALAGADPSGSEAAVRKLLGVEHDQHVQEVGMTLMGAEAAVDDGEAAGWVGAFLFNRCLTIAGGTSDIQRNVIAERLLGMPRDP